MSILRRGNTVFTFKDMVLDSRETNPDLLKRRINYYIKQGELYPIRKGVYAKDQNYDRLELAVKIFRPAYVSLETVLSREGVIFQHYEAIFVISYLSREILCDGQRYVFRRVKETVLTNPDGLENKGHYDMATRERAFLDAIYLNKSTYFDNLSSIDWDRCLQILPGYANKAMAERLDSYRRLADHA